MTVSVSKRLESGQVAIVAEVGQAHGGDLGVAFAYIDAAASCGVDAVKFQMHIADAESTAREPWRVDPGSGQSRFAYWKSMEFSRDAWCRLQDHCRKRGVEFFCSPFSPRALEILLGMGVETLKIASGEATNGQLLDLALSSDVRLVISNGLLTTYELDEFVQRATRNGREIVILQCTTRYPTPPDRVELSRLVQLQDRYSYPIGISDHSGSTYAAFGAVALGARMIEVHLDLGGDSLNLDRAASLLPHQLHDLVCGVRFLEIARRDLPVVSPDPERQRLRIIFGRSVVAARDLPVGTILKDSDLAFKKPSGGLEWRARTQLLGRSTKRLIPLDDVILASDVR